MPQGPHSPANRFEEVLGTDTAPRGACPQSGRIRNSLSGFRLIFAPTFLLNSDATAIWKVDPNGQSGNRRAYRGSSARCEGVLNVTSFDFASAAVKPKIEWAQYVIRSALGPPVWHCRDQVQDLCDRRFINSPFKSVLDIHVESFVIRLTTSGPRSRAYPAHS